MYKICSKCKEEKLFMCFSKSSRNKDGLQFKCKSCEKEYYNANRKAKLTQQKDYYEANKSKIAERHKEYTLKNSSKIVSYRKTNKSRLSEYAKGYYETNKDKIVQQVGNYYKLNKAKIAKQKREYSQTNKAKVLAIRVKRRAVKLKATPSWLSKEDFEQIEELYICAQMFKLYTGQEYHVDHIIPLQGKTVCGLHVPWNLQVIPAKENLSKSNKLLEQ